MANTVEEALPLPPDELCMRVGGTKGEEFLAQGSFLQSCLVRCLPEDLSWRGKRIFDFGCGVGRVLRHFAPQAAEAEFWGSDIHEPSISWLANNTGRLFRIILTGSEPRLPFPSNHFDLIYSVSVFTHVHKHWENWLEELKRVLIPGGIFLCTFHNRIAFEWIMHKRFDERSTGMKVYFKRRSWELGGPQIFHSDQWIAKNWGKVFAVKAIVKEGLVNWQSIAVMQKETDRGPSAVRLLQPFPYSPRNPDFTGNLDYDPLASRYWLDEHGLRCEQEAEVRGWFSSAAGPIESLRFLVDDRAVEPQKLETASGNYEGTSRLDLSFKALLEVSAFSPGAHSARVVAKDNKGHEHLLQFTLFRTSGKLKS